MIYFRPTPGSLCNHMIEIWIYSLKAISMEKEEHFNESRNLDGRDVLLGHSGYGTLFPLYESMRENIKTRWCDYDLPNSSSSGLCVHLPGREPCAAGMVLIG
jgi:hypothetical protein